MSSDASSAISPSERIGRADFHLQSAVALHAEGNEWAAVAYFYSAYHVVKAAIETDPIFNDLTRLSRVDPKISLSDHLATHHKGNPSNGRPYGVNDLVRLLYGSELYRHYSRLHSASVGVRYKDGLAPYSLDGLQSSVGLIRSSFDQGDLACRYQQASDRMR